MTVTNVAPLMRPDADQMRQHLEHLFGGDLGGHHDGLIEIAWTHSEKDPKTGKHDLKHARLFGTDEIDEAVEEAVRQNSIPNQNVYVGAALRKPTASGRCYDDDFLAMPAYYVDLDDPEAAARAKALYQHCPPTLVVVTGRQPYTRAQCWWRLDEPDTNPTRARAQNAGLAAKLNGDASVRNVGRVMRLAGSIAWPVKDGRTLERTELVIPAAQTRQSYILGEVGHGFAPIPEERAQTQLDDASYTTAATDSLGIQERIVDGRERYMRNTVLACLIEFIGQNGCVPTADELFQAAWPQYAAKVDFKRPGRGADEMREKCAAAINRFHTGRIRRARTLEEAIESYQRKEYQRPQPEMVTGTETPEEDEGPALEATPLGIIDPAKIQPRQWILGRRLIRKFVTLTVAPGGSGKSVLTMEEMVSIATGKPITGQDVTVAGPAWIYNNEDPLDELHRRIAAICLHHGIDLNGPVKDRLFLNSGRDRRLLVAKALNKAVIQTPDVDALEKVILTNQIVAMTIDPFVRVHQVEENDNAAIDAVADIFARIADRTGCAFNLVHHTRKAASGSSEGAEGVADNSRGAGSLVAAARIAHTVLAMSKKDAEALGIPAEERRWYVRMDDAKGNMSPPAEGATWFKWESIPLGNGSLGITGDEVGVLDPWDAPDIKTPVDLHMAMAILKDVDRRWTELNPLALKGSRSINSYITNAFDLTGVQAKKLVQDWISNGVLASEIVDAKTKLSGLRVKKWPGAM